MNSNRRSLIKQLSLTLSGIFGVGIATAPAKSVDTSNEKILTGEVILDQEVPLFSSAIVHNGLVFIAGKGAHFKGDIKEHTKHVLDELQKELEKAGSSMEHVLKANVYLNTLDDYKAMNEVFRGRFGNVPPVRTTIAAQGGIPGDSLVEIDCIAKLK
jgi:2-iminobutanoate/2-iminopropanoate deaminase